MCRKKKLIRLYTQAQKRVEAKDSCCVYCVIVCEIAQKSTILTSKTKICAQHSFCCFLFNRSLINFHRLLARNTHRIDSSWIGAFFLAFFLLKATTHQFHIPFQIDLYIYLLLLLDFADFVRILKKIQTELMFIMERASKQKSYFTQRFVYTHPLLTKLSLTKTAWARKRLQQTTCLHSTCKYCMCVYWLPLRQSKAKKYSNSTAVCVLLDGPRRSMNKQLRRAKHEQQHQ